MKLTADTIAHAFVDSVASLSEVEIPALVDAVAQLLIAHGLYKDARTFPSLLERVWQKKEGIVQVRLTSVSGDAGPSKEQILSIVRDTLKRPCILEERADPAMLGGLLLTVGDERFDVSLRGALKTLSQRITQPVTLLS